MQEFLEAFGLNQLVQDRAATFAGEMDLFAVPLDPFFQPTGLFGVRDVHVLQGKGAAIGALNDRHDLTHRGHLQAQNVVDKDRAIHVGFGKAVGFRVQLGMRGLVAHAQRVDVGDQVATDTIGTDDHQRADRVQHSALHLVIAYSDALVGGLGGDIFAHVRRCRVRRPLPVQRHGQVIVRGRRPIGALPRGAGGLFLDVHFGVAQGAKEFLPCLINRVRVVGILRVQLLNIFRVMPLKEAGSVEDIVGALVVHWVTSSGLGPYE